MTKTTRPIVRIHNTETNEIIDREMNDSEFAAYQADQELQVSVKVAEDTKIAQRSALLERLDITEDEAKLLLS